MVFRDCGPPPLTSTGQTSVGVRVDKELHLEEVTDLLRVEHEDSLEEHHVCRVHCHHLRFSEMQESRVSCGKSGLYCIYESCEAERVAGESPGMRDKVVDRDVNRLPRLDVPQCRNNQVVVERIWAGEHNTTHVVKPAE